MKTRTQTWETMLMLLSFLGFLLIPKISTTEARSSDFTTLDSSCVLDVDGTQLVEETKEVVADLLGITPAEVTASYCCQLLDGRFKYSASAHNKNGFVYWTIANGQIIEDDAEGF